MIGALVVRGAGTREILGARSVFVCYPRNELSCRSALVALLGARQIASRGDWEFTPGEPDYERRIRQLIAGATAFVVLLTESTRASAPCQQEMRWAIEDDKLLLPVQLQPGLGGEGFPEAIRLTQWIPAAPLEEQAGHVAESLWLDVSLFQLSAAVLPPAHAWEAAGGRGEPLRGQLLTATLAWVARAAREPQLRPRPPEVLVRFVKASVRARWRRRAIVALIAAAAIAFAVMSSRARVEQEDRTRALVADAAVAEPFVSPEMLRAAADAVRTPLAAGRAVPALASRSLARALQLTSGIEILAGAGDVTAVAVNTKQGRFAVASGSGAVRIGNVDGRAELTTLRESGPPATALAFDEHATRLLAGFADGSFTLWLAGSGRTLLQERGSPRVAFVRLAPDGESLLVARAEQVTRVQPPLVPGWFATCEVWHARGSSAVKKLHRVNAAEFVAGMGLVVGYASGVVEVLRGPDLEPDIAASLVAPQRARVDALVVPAKRSLVAILRAGASGETLRSPMTLPLSSPWSFTATGRSGLPLSGAFSDDGTMMVVAESDGRVHVFAPFPQRAGEAVIDTSSISALSFLGGAGGPVVLAGTSAGELFVIRQADDGVWRAGKLRVAPVGSSVLAATDLGGRRALIATTHDVRTLRFDERARLVETAATSSWEGLEGITPATGTTGLLVLPRAPSGWELIDAQTRATRARGDAKVRCAAFAPAGKAFLVVASEGKASLFDERGEAMDSADVTLGAPDEPVGCAVAPDGSQFVVFGSSAAAWRDVRARRTTADGLEALRAADQAAFVTGARRIFVRSAGKAMALEWTDAAVTKIDLPPGAADVVSVSGTVHRVVVASAKAGIRTFDERGDPLGASPVPDGTGILVSAAAAPGLVLVGGRSRPGVGPIVIAPLLGGDAAFLTPPMDERVDALAVHTDRDGTVIAAVASSGSVALWDAVSRERIGTLTPPHDGAMVHRLVFVPDGDLLHADSNGQVEALPGTPRRLLSAADDRANKLQAPRR